MGVQGWSRCPEVQPERRLAPRPRACTKVSALCLLLPCRPSPESVWAGAPPGCGSRCDPGFSASLAHIWQFAHPRPLSLLQRGLAPRSKGKARAELSFFTFPILLRSSPPPSHLLPSSLSPPVSMSPSSHPAFLPSLFIVFPLWSIYSLSEAGSAPRRLEWFLFDPQ